MGAREDLIAVPDEVLRHGGILQAVLVFMDFKDAPRRWWTGFGDLETGGRTWQGLGDLIGISPIETNYGISARQVTFDLAATPEMLALALAAKSRVRNRAVQVSLQMFATEDPSSAIASPISLFSGTMQRMPWAKEGPTSRTIKLECEGLFFRRNAPPRGMWTDADQKARYPGDKGFERLPLYANGYEAKWRT